MKQSDFDDSVQYYAGHYDVIARFLFVADRKFRIKDHSSEATRRCRFCVRGVPEVTFKHVAHAVPEFIGNRDILSMNECDECNSFLAHNYEDHLGNWSHLARITAQVRGKNGKPTFKRKDGSMRIDAGAEGLRIALSDPKFTSDMFPKDGPFSLTFPAAGTASKLYVPIRATMALVKVVCSICPADQLQECQPAMDWLMRRESDDS